MTMGERQYCVYILANRKNGTLYVGMTSDLARRTFEHRSRAVPGFTRHYDVMRLVWFEVHATLDAAYTREKRIKRWVRGWKIALIEESNPEWRDLTGTLM